MEFAVQDLPLASKKRKSLAIGASSHWRYAVMKRYRQRAIKFQIQATTDEQRKAWAEVIDWFDSILRKTDLNEHGAIGIPFLAIDDTEKSNLPISKP